LPPRLRPRSVVVVAPSLLSPRLRPRSVIVVAPSLLPPRLRPRSAVVVAPSLSPPRPRPRSVVAVAPSLLPPRPRPRWSLSSRLRRLIVRPRSSLSFVVVARFHCHSFACVVPPSRFFLLLCPRLPFISLSDMNYHHLVVVVVGGSSLPRPRPSGWRSASRCGVAFILPSVSSALRYVAFVTV
jgi:hypothetical protein